MPQANPLAAKSKRDCHAPHRQTAGASPARMRRLFAIALIAIPALLMASRPPAAAAQSGVDKPNMLIFLTDDHTYTDAGVYGNDDVHTPNIDQLAAEGMRFTQAFTATAMCATTRMQLYSGVYPVRNGAYPNHGKAYPSLRSMPHHLRELGYKVAIVGKRHEAPEKAFPFKYLGGTHHDSGKGEPALPLDNAARFIKENADQPWCLVVATNQPHLPWNRGEASRYDPQALTLPPYLADTPDTRKTLARYYAEVTYADKQLGQVRDFLEASDQLDETLFLYTSEQGTWMPYGKWTLYDTGIRTQLIVRWPEKVAAGTTTDAMVEYVDVVPTLVEAAGGEPASVDVGVDGGPDGGSGFDGDSFLDVLTGEQDDHGQYIYGVQTTRGIYQGSEAYPIRCVRTDQYKLILNLNPLDEFSNLVTERFGPFQSWREIADENKHARELVEGYEKRPAVELYDVEADPFEQNNLADKERYQPVIDRLNAKLKQWMAQQGDLGIATELRAEQRQAR